MSGLAAEEARVCPPFAVLRHQRSRSLVVQDCQHLFADPEVRDAFGQHFDAGSRLGIACDPSLPLPRVEASEAPNLDFVAGPQRLNHGVENNVHDGLGLLVGIFKLLRTRLQSDQLCSTTSTP